MYYISYRGKSRKQVHWASNKKSDDPDGVEGRQFTFRLLVFCVDAGAEVTGGSEYEKCPEA